MTTTPYNHKAYRRLDWALLIFFAVSVLLAVHALNAKHGMENWINWLWIVCAAVATTRVWNRLFGKRPA